MASIFRQQRSLRAIRVPYGSLCLALCLSLSCSACSSSSAPGLSQSQAWLRRGSIAVASPLPAVTSPSNRTLLGFLPADVEMGGTWLSIDTASGTARLMRGHHELHTLTIKAAGSVPPGTYELLHKQKGALWRASDEYFERRSLPVPAAGDQSRYLRGALGDFVLYADHDLPLHNAAAWCSEVGGIQLSEEDISQLYERLEIGALIEVN